MVKKKKEAQIKLEEAAKLQRMQEAMAGMTASPNGGGSAGTAGSPGSSNVTAESVSDEAVLLRPKIAEYRSHARRKSVPGGKVGHADSPTGPGSSGGGGSTSTSARQPGMEDLEEDGDVVFN